MDFKGKFTDEHVQEIEKHLDFNQGSITEHYDKISSNYEEIYTHVGWPDPVENARFVKEISEEAGLKFDDVRILDFACGTGLVGQYLSEHGFKNVDGCDASPDMLKELQVRRPNVYTNTKELFLGKPDTFPKEYHGVYNFTTASGVLADNHMGVEVYQEMIMSVKVGGWCCFNVRKEYMEPLGYGPGMDKLEQEGVWKKVKEATHFKYDQYKEQVGRFKKTEVFTFAYQRLK